MRPSQPMRRTLAAVGAVACAALVLSACTDATAQPQGSSGDGQGFVSGGGDALVINPADRVAAPDVSGTTLDGDQVALSDFAGKVVVLNVWASWCGPCRGEAPALQEVAKVTASKGVQFLGLNTRDDVAAAKAFDARYKITYPSLVDADGQLQVQFRDSLPPSAIPSTLIIDRNGRVAARILGATTYSQLKGLVDDVAAEAK